MSKDLEVRCFCTRKPLLAVCGRDSKTAKPFVHIKSVKKDRLNTEAVVTSGEVSIRCRECLRWHKVRIVHQEIESKPEHLPETIQV